MLSAICVHGYFGGMEMGIAQQSGVKVLGSYEDWQPGMEARRCASCSYLSELQPLSHSKLPQVDFVFGNPPCSRFSLTAQWTFKEGAQAELSKFQQLEELVHVALKAKANLVWWETGPLCWTKGRDMVVSVADELAKKWGKCYTYLVRFDLRYIGIPQRRPRCHVIHSKIPMVGLGPDRTGRKWPIEETIGPWMQRRIKELGITPECPITPDSWWGNRPGGPMEIAKWMHAVGDINHTKPVRMSVTDAYAPAVLSGRCTVWVEENRWMTIEENAILMSIDPELAKKVYYKMDGQKALMFLSKGVSPSASGFVYKTVVEPLLNGKKINVGDNCKLYHVDGKKSYFEIDCGVKDADRKRYAEDRE